LAFFDCSDPAVFAPYAPEFARGDCVLSDLREERERHDSEQDKRESGPDRRAKQRYELDHCHYSFICRSSSALRRVVNAEETMAVTRIIAKYSTAKSEISAETDDKAAGSPDL